MPENSSNINLNTISVLRTVKMLVVFMLIINIGIIGFLFNHNEKQISLNEKSIEYHLATENNAIKLVKEIKNSQLLLDELDKNKASIDDDELTRNQQEILENLRHIVNSRTKIIITNHKIFQDPYFDKTISRLQQRAQTIIQYIDSHRFTLYELEEINTKLPLLVIAANQIGGLHETAFHETQSEAEALNSNNFITIVTLIVFATLLTLVTTRVGLFHIQISLIKQQQTKEEVDRINRELEQRVLERTHDLESSNARLKTSLTQLKLAQNQLVQSEKMASLGGLVAGVAHEINTPIGIGLSAISHLSMKIDSYTKSYEKGELTKEGFENLLYISNESCSLVQMNLERAAQLIKSFKQVSVDQSQEQKRRINVKNYLHNIYTSLLPTLKPTKHSVNIHCEPEITLTLNPGALSQVISNLIVNSLNHGFENVEFGEINIRVTKNQNIVELVYSDNGVGIPEEIGEKIFEPFYTTKRDAGGSGLGMHIVYNLVTQSMEGSINLLQGNQNQGVCFIIQLPIQSNPPQSSAA